MNHHPLLTRLGLVILIGLLALPIARIGSPVEAKNRPRTVTRAFRNSAAIALPVVNSSHLASADLYPSAIVVGGLKGTIRDVNVTLTALTHGYAEDIEALLVGPGGQAAVVMAGVGGGDDADGVTLRLDDEAAAPLPDDASLRSGAFQPTNDEGVITFNDPAPSAGTNAALDVFDGTRPNGTWRLFVQDEYASDAGGSFAGGWELELTTKAKARKKR